MTYIFTCEHGGNRIPAKYRYLFEGREGILNSHRGWDMGALDLARACARDCAVPLYFSDISRLLIDMNRSVHHRGLFSEFTRGLNDRMKQEVLDKYYYAYRNPVEDAVREHGPKPVVHLSFHSFVPELDGKVRTGDIGLLYDPARTREKEFSRRLQIALKQCCPGLRIRRNYPYLGIADGFTRYLRGRYPGNKYLGIELEINQKHIISQDQVWNQLLDHLGGLLKRVDVSG